MAKTDTGAAYVGAPIRHGVAVLACSASRVAARHPLRTRRSDTFLRGSELRHSPGRQHHVRFCATVEPPSPPSPAREDADAPAPPATLSSLVPSTPSTRPSSLPRTPADLADDDELCVVDECTERYKEPPPNLTRLVDANVDPSILIQPVHRRFALVLQRPNLPQIAELAYPELRLAGYRFHPETYTPSRSQFYQGIALQRIANDATTPLPIHGLDHLPSLGRRGAKPEIGYVMWSPDGSKVAFCVFLPGYGLELWILRVGDNTDARRAIAPTATCVAPGRRLHAVCGAPYAWSSDSASLLVKFVDDDAARRGPPQRSPVPRGPLVQDFAGGKPAPSRTYQDLLKSAHDREMFEYYTQCALERVVLGDGEGGGGGGGAGRVVRLGDVGAVRRAGTSPDGRYVLVDKMQKPFEFLTPAARFPRRVVIMSMEDGSEVAEVANIPLQDKIPIAFDGVGEGPRSIGWRSDVDATIYWVEAQDGGDPAVDVDVRDVVYALSAPFTGNPRKLVSLPWRFSGIEWGTEQAALIAERLYKNRSSRQYLFCPGPEHSVDDAEQDPEPQGPCCLRACDLSHSAAPKRLVIDRPNWEDRYSDPGSVISRNDSRGKSVLHLVYRPADGERKYPLLLLSSAGASDAGNRPHLALYDTRSLTKTMVWQSTPPFFETIAGILRTNAHTHLPEIVLLRREAPQVYPNFHIYDLSKSYDFSVVEKGVPESGGQVDTKPRCFIRPLTNYPHPAPQLMHVKRELVNYERKDGVRLNAIMYTPPGFTPGKDKPLPLLVWAYPREFKNAQFAGQVQDSPFRFVRIARSPLIFLAMGFAILDGPQMPIIGEGDEEPNDSYIPQLVSSAQAAVDYVVSRGVADRGRIAVGGHSYGAFMAANLLAHAPGLFACGIARSGAYNRTLTPFGFQSEERTLWQARDVYVDMSPYLYAHKIEAPLLLVHGEKDDNPGTFTMQSERLYQAMKGHGKVARLVVLPFEEHGYRARESVLHALYEMVQWMTRYCGEGFSEVRLPAPETEGVTAET